MREFVRKQPLDSLLILILFYSIVFTSYWTGGRLIQKALYSVAALAILTLLDMFELGWAKFYYRYKNALLTNLISEYYQSANIVKKFLLATPWSVQFFVFLAVLEFIVNVTIFGREHLLTVGFPYPIFSFVVYRPSLWGIFFNIVVFNLLILVVASILKNSEKLSKSN